MLAIFFIEDHVRGNIVAELDPVKSSEANGSARLAERRHQRDFVYSGPGVVLTRAMRSAR